MPRVNIPKDDLIPEGWYRATIEDIQEKTTRIGGDEMWALRLRITEGEYADRIVKDNLVFSAAAHKRLRIFAKAMGLPSSGTVEFEKHDIQDREVQIEVASEEYNGETQSKVTFRGYKAVPPKPRTAADADEDRDPF